MSDRSDSQLDQYWDALRQNRHRDATDLKKQIADNEKGGDQRAIRLLDDLNDVRLLLQNEPTISQSGDDTGKSMIEPVSVVVPGNQFGDYEIKYEIARGGMGVVYAARQVSMNRDVALKLIKSGPLADHEDLKRFKSESIIGGQLTHPGIVQFYENGSLAGIHYFSMELVQGQNLSQILRDGPIEPHRAAGYLRAICDALGYAHSRGILHRDLKPSNILIDRFDNPRITDFGLAKWIADGTKTNGNGGAVSEMTKTGMTIGTPSYMSPEQAIGDNKSVSTASDIYSIGAVLYECITGRAPFRADTPIETLRQVVDAEPAAPHSLNRNIPRDLETICLKAIQKDPSRRYDRAIEFGEDLQRFLDGKPVMAKPVSSLRKFNLWCRRNQKLAVTLALLVVSLVAGTIISTAMWIKSEQNAADLLASRQRLRESVDQFQSKVFSSEALHWQMSGEFRKEMFRDVISYLDEFAAHEEEFIQAGEGGDELTADYLEVAEAAVKVGDLDEGFLATERALERIRKITISDGSRVAENWYLRSRAEHLAHLVKANDKDQNSEHVRLAEAALRSANRAHDIDRDEVRYRVNIWEMEYQKVLDYGGKETEPELARIFRSLESLDQLLGERFKTAPRDIYLKIQQKRRDALNLQILVGLSLLELRTKDDFEASAERLVDLIYRVRERYRHLSEPMNATDRFFGLLFRLQAERYWETGEQTKAIENIEKAEKFLIKALEVSPQNRVWRGELAQIQGAASDYLESLDQLKPAREKTDLAIRNYMRILASDHKDLETRLLGIYEFKRYGELSAELNDSDSAYRGFYTACQECVLLTTYHRGLEKWAYYSKAWLLAQALQHLKTSTQRDKYDEILEVQTKLMKKMADDINRDTDTRLVDYDWAMNVINGEIEIEPPGRYEPIDDS